MTRGTSAGFWVLALSVLVAGLLAAEGCDDESGGGGNDGGPDEGCATDTAGDGATKSYIMNAVAIGDENVGFDLDDVNTPSGCSNDFCRSGPDDGTGGVDNRLGPILESISDASPQFDVAGFLNKALTAGKMLLLLRLRDVDDWRNDGCVHADFYVGHDTNDPPAIVEGRTYQVDSASLEPPGTDIDSPSIAFEGGSIEGGTFRGGPDDFAMTIPIEDLGTSLTFAVSEAQIQWSASESAISNGTLGGYIPIFNLLATMRLIPEAANVLVVVTTVMENQADVDSIPGGTEIPGTQCTQDNIDSYDAAGNGCGSASYTCSPSGRCVEPDDHFDAVSLGITIAGIPAEIGDIWTAP